MDKKLEKLWRQGSLRDIDYYFADFIRRMVGEEDEILLLTAALTSWAVGESHSCIDINNLAGRIFPATDAEYESSFKITLPEIEEWQEGLRSVAATLCIGKPGEIKPLIYDSAGRIYLHRYWQYEDMVARVMLRLAVPLSSPEYPPALGERLNVLFDAPSAHGGDIKRLAGFLSLRNRLTIISGGPGTGKTFIVARILALLAEARYCGEQKEQPFSVKLAAPTGKAAARMGDSVRDAISELNISNEIQAVIPQEEPVTIHRLLGTIPDSPSFRHNSNNPLDADVVIIDEASMIDLPLMAKLLDALPLNARLILLGDMNQLASVAPGNVYGDICSAVDAESFSESVRDDFVAVSGDDEACSLINWNGNGGLGDCIVKLDYSHRFKPDSDIGKLSRAINSPATDADRVWNLLQEAVKKNDISWVDIPDNISDAHNYPAPDLAQAIIAGYKNYLMADNIEDMFEAIKEFRVLSALRNGPYGVNHLNKVIEKVLSSSQAQLEKILKPAGLFYERKLIMVTVNDYSVRLFNGDIGIIMYGKNSGDREKKLYAYFEVLSDEGEKAVRMVPVNMLPATEPAFAMTIHKSQGSEFNKVLMLLPEAGNRVLTKELLYTGITRTKRYVDIWCSEKAFKDAVTNKTVRSSGLKDRLRS